MDLFVGKKPHYDAILLDVDNGPEGMTHSDNHWLYSLKGLAAIYKMLRPEGAGPDQLFTIRLKKARFNVSMHTVRVSKGRHHTIWLAQKPWRSAEDYR